MKKIPLAAIVLSLMPTVGMAAIGITTPSVNSGELIRASDWNKIRLDLQTLAGSLDALSNQSWSSSGSNIYYNVGNVGIGINSPTGLMHLYADTPAANDVLFQLGTSDDADRVRIDEDGDMTIDGKLVVRDSDIYESGGDLELSGEDSLYLTMDWNNDDADTQSILFGKNDDGAGVDFVELMRLDEGGNVGIGTATPFSKLQVDGSIQVGSDSGACDADKTGAMRYAGGAIERCDGTTWDALATTNVSDNLGSHEAEQNLDLGIFTLVGNGGTEGVSILNSGRVGVGVVAPTVDLEVAGRTRLGDITSTSPGNQGVQVYTGNSGNASSGLDLIRGTSWVTPSNIFGMRLVSDGSGVYRGALGMAAGSSFTEQITLRNGGNIGVGTTSPDSLLQILKTSPTANQTILKIGTDADESRFSVDEDGDVFSDGNYYVGGGNVISPSNGGSLTVGGEDNLYLAMDRTNDDADSRSIILGKNDVGGAANWVELMRVDESGEVGIGTNVPANRLHVIENTNTDRIATFENQATTGSPEGLLVLTGQGAGPAPAFAVGTGTEASHTNNFVVTNAGNVGIGSTSPARRLAVLSPGANDGIVLVASDGSNLVTMTESGPGYGYVDILDATGGQSVRLNAGGLSYFNGGNVGIGTTSPNSLLQVSGGRINVSAGNGSGQVFRVDDTIGPYIQIDRSGAGLATIGYAGGIVTGGGSNLGFNAASGKDIVFGAAAAETLRIKSNGNVGIGTTSPSGKLTMLAGNNSDSLIIGLAENSDTYAKNRERVRLGTDGWSGGLWLNNGSDVNTVKITALGDSYFDGGNVGIGTTSPTSKLTVASPQNGGAALKLEHGAWTRIGGENTITASSNTYIASSGGIGFDTNIPNGATNPTGYDLYIAGTGEVEIQSISSDGTGKVVCILSNGNLGTCTDAPNASGACSCS